MRITALAGGIGAARFLRGLVRAAPGADITVIGNTADDITVSGLRVCPDLDTVMYTLGGGIHETQGWGRAEESFVVSSELRHYGIEPSWFNLGDRDLATHIVRTHMLDAGYPLSAVTEALCDRWQPGVRLLPMSDDRIETHVVIADPDAEGGQRAIHFQEYWVRLHAEPVALAVTPIGAATATAAPGVLDALATADLIILPPSNPVVSIGTILAVPGVRSAVQSTSAPVIGVSPIVNGAPVRGMADKLLATINVAVTADGVGGHYGGRASGGILDGWLVDDSDAACVSAVAANGIACRAIPLLMTDVSAAAAIASAVIDLAGERVSPRATG
jgi:LPPG:FO 2-phospho-L-lactate transferase